MNEQTDTPIDHAEIAWQEYRATRTRSLAFQEQYAFHSAYRHATKRLERELAAAVAERNERMLESKMIEHILDDEEGWRQAIEGIHICPTMQSAIALQNERDSLLAVVEAKDQFLKKIRYNSEKNSGWWARKVAEEALALTPSIALSSQQEREKRLITFIRSIANPNDEQDTTAYAAFELLTSLSNNQPEETK